MMPMQQTRPGRLERLGSSGGAASRTSCQAILRFRVLGLVLANSRGF